MRAAETSSEPRAPLAFRVSPRTCVARAAGLFIHRADLTWLSLLTHQPTSTSQAHLRPPQQCRARSPAPSRSPAASPPVPRTSPRKHFSLHAHEAFTDVWSHRSIIFIVFYAAMFPIAVWRLATPSSRCWTLLRPLIFILARIVTFIFRAMQASGNYAQALFIGEQVRPSHFAADEALEADSCNIDRSCCSAGSYCSASRY